MNKAVTLREVQKEMVKTGAAKDDPENNRVIYIPGEYVIKIMGKEIRIRAISENEIIWD